MNLANKLTLFRVIIVPFFVFFMCFTGIEHRYLYALILFIIASITDMLDGKIARKYNMITSFGKGLVKAIPIAVRGIGQLTIALVKATLKLPGKLLSAGIEAVKAFVKGLKRVRLPKFKITWSTESKQGEKGSLIKIPKPNLTWYKTGGIFSSPSVIGVGEAGSEAVVPLAEFWNKLEGFFKGKNDSGGGGGILHLILQLDGKTIGQTVVEYINGQTIMFGESPITV